MNIMILQINKYYVTKIKNLTSIHSGYYLISLSNSVTRQN